MLESPHASEAHTSDPGSPAVLEPAKNETFQREIQAYINEKLPEDIKKDFQSASDIMETLQRMQHHQSGSGSQMRISNSTSDRVKKVLQCLRHFTGSVENCVRHSSDISSIIIGGANYILTVRGS